MKKIIILVALATTLAMAGHYVYVTQPDGTVIECYIYNNGDIDCQQ